jgi:phosphate:Na+ symporter
MATPELSLVHARKEIADMAELARSMFDRIRQNLADEAQDFESELEWFTAKENFADSMREELSKFLIDVTTLDISEKTRTRVGMKLRIIGELENMTDECLSIAYLLRKKKAKHLELDIESLSALTPFAELVDEFLEFVISKLHVGMSELELGRATEMEDRIDAVKKHLKKLARRRLKEGADVKAELLYIDLIRHVEKVGDCAFGVAGELRQYQA